MLSTLIGQICYENLEIKKSCLDSLSVPVGIIRGVVRSLSVVLTASSVFSKEPLRITVRVCEECDLFRQKTCAWWLNRSTITLSIFPFETIMYLRSLSVKSVECKAIRNIGC